MGPEGDSVVHYRPLGKRVDPNQGDRSCKAKGHTPMTGAFSARMMLFAAKAVQTLPWLRKMSTRCSINFTLTGSTLLDLHFASRVHHLAPTSRRTETNLLARLMLQLGVDRAPQNVRNSHSFIASSLGSTMHEAIWVQAEIFYLLVKTEMCSIRLCM
ncbi:hypothetical protein K432DRAFT_397360 [Lepidopterella palustris CBS 459.81]|uniref:Uncharacterized protein n=1 Tax=Lepidopterella palustris CBS 459.81 TaxID=1314670 RepID=A0A8E2JAG1_9PEZI|nr:hypothetical protein K432DRAFT_397360 [Lepidopterella palustris CBS 459.81]